MSIDLTIQVYDIIKTNSGYINSLILVEENTYQYKTILVVYIKSMDINLWCTFKKTNESDNFTLHWEDTKKRTM